MQEGAPILLPKENLRGDILGSIFDSVKEGIIFIDASNRFCYINKAEEQIRGINSKEWLNRSVLECHPAPSHEKVAKIIEELKDGKREFHHKILKVGERFYDSTYSRVLSSEGEYLGIALVHHDVTDKLKLQAQLEESNRELSLLQQINNALNSTMSLEEILQIIVTGITSTFGYDLCAVHLLSEDGSYLICKSYSADSRIVEELEKLTGISAKNYRIPLFKESLLLKVIQTKQPIITSDIHGLVRDHTESSALRALAPAIASIVNVSSGIGVPLLAGDRVVGLIGVASKKRLSEHDVGRLGSFARQVGLAVERAKLYESLREKSNALRRVLEKVEFIKSELEVLDREPPFKALSNPLRVKILKFLSSSGRARFTEIKMGLGIKAGPKLIFHLRQLKDEHLVEQDEEKRYYLSTTGRRALLSLR